MNRKLHLNLQVFLFRPSEPPRRPRLWALSGLGQQPGPGERGDRGWRADPPAHAGPSSSFLTAAGGAEGSRLRSRLCCEASRHLPCDLPPRLEATTCGGIACRPRRGRRDRGRPRPPSRDRGSRSAAASPTRRALWLPRASGTRTNESADSTLAACTDAGGVVWVWAEGVWISLWILACSMIGVLDQILEEEDVSGKLGNPGDPGDRAAPRPTPSLTWARGVGGLPVPPRQLLL